MADMNPGTLNCVLLGDRHHGITEGIRGLLETSFSAVVMVADETSLIESAARLQPALVVVDLSLARTDSLRWLQRLRACSPASKIIVLSVHDEPSVARAALEAGADVLILKRCLATELLPAIDALLHGAPHMDKQEP
jgi:DNA-binding NarL/FixJ family response regulator